MTVIDRFSCLLHHMTPTGIAAIIAETQAMLESDVPGKIARNELETIVSDAVEMLYDLVGKTEACELIAAATNVNA